jgi:acetylornithine deacetylase/succinyl-diaminopimelate desuccinylase-like protein
MLVPILAVEALLKGKGSLPVNVKFLFEGQEEIGSPQLADFVVANKELLACDLAVSADGSQWSETEPANLVSLRGICTMQIDIKGAKTDLHSGTYGGSIQNPIHALIRLLDSMRDPEGKILVEGFYDNVVDLSDADRAEIRRVPYDEAEYLESLGLNELFGEPGYSTLERTWIRPTLEMNGIWGGFQGTGTKTVLPSEAHAKISCRLVANQDPHRIVELVTAHIEKHSPPGVKVNVSTFASARPYQIPTDHPGNEAARAVYEELYDKRPYYIRSGGTIPICGLLFEHLGIYTVGFAFGLQDEGAHAPNEFFRLSSFDIGQKAYCKLLHGLAEQAL